jgi:hypothetical protein
MMKENKTRSINIQAPNFSCGEGNCELRMGKSELEMTLPNILATVYTQVLVQYIYPASE